MTREWLLALGLALQTPEAAIGTYPLPPVVGITEGGYPRGCGPIVDRRSWGILTRSAAHLERRRKTEPATYAITRCQLSASDHEAAEGYIACGQQLAFLWRPGQDGRPTVGHQQMIDLTGKTITVLLRVEKD